MDTHGALQILMALYTTKDANNIPVTNADTATTAFPSLLHISINIDRPCIKLILLLSNYNIGNFHFPTLPPFS